MRWILVKLCRTRKEQPGTGWIITPNELSSLGYLIFVFHSLTVISKNIDCQVGMFKQINCPILVH